ncbi:MAG TPA: hypothetical protein VL359_14910 [bacterium]|nr:hypothetical protein [bacterium]HUJ76151.1 hypothetical protein [bacterium]
MSPRGLYLGCFTVLALLLLAAAAGVWVARAEAHHARSAVTQPR